MKTFLISPRQNLTEFIAETLGRHDDYSSCLVVFPGKRPSHFLRQALARCSGGRSLIPPRIFSMDAFVDFLFEDVLMLPEHKIEAIDAVALLFRIHSHYSSPLGGPRFSNAASFLPLGTKLYSDLEELLIEGVTPDQVRKIDNIAGMRLPIQSQERMQSLSFFYEEFYRQTREMGLATRSQRYKAVAAGSSRQSFSRFRLIVVAGFFALSHAERELFSKLSVLSQTVSVFQDGTGIDTRMAELGLTKVDIEDMQDTSAGPSTSVKFYRSPDTHGQIFGLNTILSDGSTSNGESERDLIVIPSSETLFPLVHNCVALSGSSAYNISLGYPLVRTPLYGFLRSLAEVIITADGERIHVPTYLSLILHPYMKNIYFHGRADVTRMLFHGIETDLTKRQKKFATLEEIEGSDELLQRLSLQAVQPPTDLHELRGHVQQIHDNTIRKFVRCFDLGDFAGKLIDLIQYIYQYSSARLHPFFHPFSESLVEHLSILRKSLMKDMVFHEMADYFNFLRRYATSCHVPFEGTPLKGLQVLGLLETRNLKFDRVFVLDANEDVISGVRKEDSLLPQSVRRELGLPDYRRRAELTAYYLDVLLNGAAEAYFFYVENGRKERSRFVERLVWEKQKARQRADEGIDISAISYAVRLENRMPSPIEKDSMTLSFLQDFVFSATALDRYLRCPLSFYYRYVMGLSRRDEAPDEIEGQELGRFVHNCLHIYFERRKGRRLLTSDIDTAEMQDVVDNTFSKSYGEETSGNLYLVRKQAKHHLSDFLVKYQLPLLQQKDIAILGLEQTVGCEWNGFRLVGRIDRVEKRDGDIFIIDYKTGVRTERLKIRFDKLCGATREKWPVLIGSLQLVFYLLAYSLGCNQQVDRIHPMFLMLGRSSIDKAIEEPLFAADDDYAERMELLKQIMKTLLSEVVDPSSPFEPTAFPGRFCPWCDFQSLCGTRWIKK